MLLFFKNNVNDIVNTINPFKRDYVKIIGYGDFSMFLCGNFETEKAQFDGKMMDAHKSDIRLAFIVFFNKSDNILNAINTLKCNVLCEIIAT